MTIYSSIPSIDQQPVPIDTLQDGSTVLAASDLISIEHDPTLTRVPRRVSILELTGRLPIPYNWASRPDPASVPPGTEIWISDIPAGGQSRWYSDGSYWRLYAPIKLAGSGAAGIALTGVTVATVMAQITVPGGAMGPTGGLNVMTKNTVTNSANAKVIRTLLGVTVLATGSVTTNTYVGMLTNIQNRGVQNAQIGNPQNLFQPYANGVNAQETAIVDTTQDQVLSIVYVPANAADSMLLESWEVWLYN